MTILARYMPLINKHSIIDGILDEDLRQYIIMRVVEQLPKFNPDPGNSKGRSDLGLISDRSIYDINLLLSNAFDKAVDWEYVGKNPVTRNACPDRVDKPREIWDPDTAKAALAACKDPILPACIHMAIACSMRIGEITGLRWQFKQLQEELKSVLGDEYQDYDMVIAQSNGRPIEGGHISEMFSQLINENEFPKVEFHSLRHLSTTVKLLISKGDVKSVQGETGHSQAKMVTDTYAHILDQNRRTMAKKFEKSFYGGKEDERCPEGSPEQVIAQCLKNPEALEILRSLLAVKPAELQGERALAAFAGTRHKPVSNFGLQAG